MCIHQILVMARAVGCCLAVCDYNHGPFDLGKRWIAAGDAIIVIMGMAWEMDWDVSLYYCAFMLV